MWNSSIAERKYGIKWHECPITDTHRMKDGMPGHDPIDERAIPREGNLE